MSYAIIRNEKKKISDLSGLYKHNRRKNKNSSNKDINELKTYENYFIKKCPTTYTTQLNNLIEKHNLLDTTKTIKKNRVVACEMIITSDNEFFNSIGEQEEKRYFQEAFNFISKYKGLTEEFIVDAVVHKDEKEPHMHLIFIPVLHSTNIETGDIKVKLDSSGYWKGKDSYKRLQDEFYSHIKNANFNLERGKENFNAKHYEVKEFKRITEYKVKELPKEFITKEIPIETNNKTKLKEDYIRVINKCNSMSGSFINLNGELNNFIKNQKENELSKDKQIKDLKHELHSANAENEKLGRKNTELNNLIDLIYEYMEVQYNLARNIFRSALEIFRQVKERINNQMNYRYEIENQIKDKKGDKENGR